MADTEGLPAPTSNPQSKAYWYYHRLRSMSVGEVAHRLGEQLRRANWRSYRGGWKEFEVGDGPLPAIPGLRDALRRASADLRHTIDRATHAILDRPLELFGQSFGDKPLPQIISRQPSIFHFDPVSRRHWPADTYCFDISYRTPDGYGDYKFCAELNTMQVCQMVAAAAQAEQNQELADLAWAIWNAWWEANSPFLGINWVSGVNIALRIVSLIVTASLIDPPPGEVRLRLRALLNASGFWIERYPSLHSSANNHLIAESVALFALGMLAPDLPASRRRAALARRRIEREVFRQILPDGVGAEMSPSYTAFAIEWLLLAAVIADLKDEPFEPSFLDRLGRAASHFKWLMDGAAQVPSIGDNDNSCVIGSAVVAEERYVASMSAAVAGVTGNPAWSPVAYDPSLRDIVFHPPVAGSPPGVGVRHFERGGISVVREQRGATLAVLIFDHGPLGYLRICAHGHADTLALWLSIGTQPVFVDAGTYLYGGDMEWRDYFRATQSHNTVEIAGRSSSVMAGAFNWSSKACGRLLSVHDKAPWSMEAGHDGYGPCAGRHVRRVSGTTSGFRIEDELVGVRSAPARIGFLAHPNLRTLIEGETAHLLLGEVAIVSLTSVSHWTPEVLRGMHAPTAGWYSARFGLKMPADQIVFAGELNAGPVITDVVIHSKP